MWHIFFFFLLFWEFSLGNSDQQCGKITTKATFIKNGQRVNHVWPWMGSLGYWNGNLWTHYCGVSLVSLHQALTAAHCAQNDEVLQKIAEGVLLVRFGDNNITGNQSTTTEIVKVQGISVHPGYFGFYHDLSILTFSSVIPTSKFVSPVCLPEASSDREELDDAGLIITGWGDRKNNGGRLEMLVVQVYNNVICSREWNGASQSLIKYYIPNLFSDDIFCTGHFAGPVTGSTTCHGDSGGPIVKFDKEGETYFQKGVVTGGQPECRSNLPNVFVRLDDPSNLHWINETMMQKFEFPNDYEWSKWKQSTQKCENGLCVWKRHCQKCAGSGCQKCADRKERCRKCSNKECSFPKSCFTPDEGSWKFEKWGGWTGCSQSCGVGTRLRTRKCQCKGITCNSCPGDEKELSKCKDEKCPDEATRDEENQEFINGCDEYSPESWSDWSHWSICTKSCWNLTTEQRDSLEYKTAVAERGLTQRVRFGVLNNEKNCTERHTRPCIDMPPCQIKDHFAWQNPYIPTDYCSLPVEEGCSGRYSFIGDCISIEKLQTLPTPAYTMVTKENRLISKKLGTHPILCCPLSYASALSTDKRVGCHDLNNVGLEGNNADVWYNCSLSEECILKEACPLFKIVTHLSIEHPNLSSTLQAYLRKDCAGRGTCCPKEPIFSSPIGQCGKENRCTYKWNCMEYVKARATLDMLDPSDGRRKELIEDFKNKICDSKLDTICCSISGEQFAITGIEQQEKFKEDVEEIGLEVGFKKMDPGYRFEKDGYENILEETPSEFKLNNNCSNKKEVCTDFKYCQDLYQDEEFFLFNKTNIKVCGWNDDTKTVKVCCEKEGTSMNKTPVYPIMPGYDCEDKTPLCEQWAQHGACQFDIGIDRPNRFNHERNLFNNIEVWDFMVTSCARTCNFCGFKGCRNEHPDCEVWTRAGRCLTNPFFMGYTCRESCGVCGFFSHSERRPQTSHTSALKDYTNVNNYNFECGKFSNVRQQPRSKRSSAGQEPSHYFADGGVISTSNKLSVWNSVWKSGGDDIYCEVTMISDKYALSAAQCFDVFGRGNGLSRNIQAISINSLTSEPEIVEILDVIMYPLYNDIAILKLGRRVAYDYESKGVTPACIKRDAVQNGTWAKLVARGLTEYGTRGQLLESEVQIISNKNCENIVEFEISKSPVYIQRFEQKFPHGVTKDTLCATGIENDVGIFSGSCKGDSGAALYIEEEGLKKIVGIASGGFSCGGGLPGFYTRVSEYLPWIDCILGGLLGSKRTQDVTTECKAVSSPK